MKEYTTFFVLLFYVIVYIHDYLIILLNKSINNKALLRDWKKGLCRVRTDGYPNYAFKQM